MFSRLFSFLMCGVAAVTVAAAAPPHGKTPKKNPKGEAAVGAQVQLHKPRPNPVNANQLVGYLLADNELSITQDNAVVKWESSNGAPMTLMQESEGYQPLYVPKAIKNLPGITFNGASDVLMGVTPTLPGNNRTITVVVSLDKLPVNLVPLVLFNGTEGLGLLPSGALRAYMTINAEEEIEFAETEPLTGPAVVSLCMGDGSTQIFVNGTRVGLIHKNVASSEHPPQSTFQLGSNGFSGSIGAVVFFNRLLPPVERRALETDFAKKFGITMEEESPLPYKVPRMGKVINGK